MKIRIAKGPRRGTTLLVDSARTTIGRMSDSDIALPGDLRVSRRHCELYRRGASWTLVDVGSSNGTFVNGRFVTVPTELTDGDVISIGDSELMVLLEPEFSSWRTSTPAPTPLNQLKLTGSLGAALLLSLKALLMPGGFLSS